MSKAVQGNQFEVDASRLALKTSQDAAVRDFARTMIDVHTQRLADLKAAALKVEPGMTFPVTVSAEQQQMLEALQQSGRGFEVLYKHDMELVHAQTFGVLQTYTSAATANASLRAFAQHTLATVKLHWERARKLPGMEI